MLPPCTVPYIIKRKERFLRHHATLSHCAIQHLEKKKGSYGITLPPCAVPYIIFGKEKGLYGISLPPRAVPYIIFRKKKQEEKDSNGIKLPPPPSHCAIRIKIHTFREKKKQRKEEEVMSDEKPTTTAGTVTSDPLVLSHIS